MATLMGKFKNHDWEEIDKTNLDSDYTEEEQKTHLLNEYKMLCGREYMFKWENTELVLA